MHYFHGRPASAPSELRGRKRRIVPQSPGCPKRVPRRAEKWHAHETQRRLHVTLKPLSYRLPLVKRVPCRVPRAAKTKPSGSGALRGFRSLATVYLVPPAAFCAARRSRIASSGSSGTFFGGRAAYGQLSTILWKRGPAAPDFEVIRSMLG